MEETILSGAYGDPDQFMNVQVRFPDDTSVPIEVIRQLAADGIIDDTTIASYEKAENAALKERLRDHEASLHNLSNHVSRLCEQLQQQNDFRQEVDQLRAKLAARDATIMSLTSARQESPQLPVNGHSASGLPSGQDGADNATTAQSPPPGTPGFKHRVAHLQKQIDILSNSEDPNNTSTWTDKSAMYQESFDGDSGGFDPSFLNELEASTGDWDADASTGRKHGWGSL